MRSRLPSTTLICISLILAPLVAAAAPRAQGANEVAGLYRDLPRDPLLVLGIHTKNAAGTFRGLLSLYARFASQLDKDRTSSGLAGIDNALASMFENEILPFLGPEIVLAVDLPPIDEAVSALGYPRGKALTAFLDRAGVVAHVRDGQKLDRALRRLISRWGGESRKVGELTEAVLPLAGSRRAGGSDSETSALKFYYGR